MVSYDDDDDDDDDDRIFIPPYGYSVYISKLMCGDENPFICMYCTSFL